jgi:hypothetical protein
VTPGKASASKLRLAMSRKEGALNEGLHQGISEVAGSESAERGPGLAAGLNQGQVTITPLGDGAGGAAAGGGSGEDSVDSAGPSNTSSPSATRGENRSDSETDPHICKYWPCPQCHKPRDAVDDDEMAPNAGQYSAKAATRTQSFFLPHEPLQLERSEDSGGDDLLLDRVASSVAHAGTQNQKGHC